MPGPSDLEQLLLEYINDARIDPMGDAARYITSYNPLTSSNSDIGFALQYFGVDGAKLLAAYSALTAVAPLAWNDILASTARAHSQKMIDTDTQDHNLPGETLFGQRQIDAGYNYNMVGGGVGENIFAYGSSDLDAQGAFMVDWGGSAADGGMQNPAGHRNNIMSSSFREVGIGIVAHTPTSSNNTGPYSITEDFGFLSNTGAIILGTAYNDNDHDNFYSVGEGLSTLTVSVGTSSVTSWSSGGYTLKLGVTGAQTVNFSGAGLTGTVSAAVTLASISNLMFEVVNGNTLQTTASASVTGTLGTLQGMGITGLTLTGGASVANIIGSKGNDVITGGSGNNIITGGLGNDTINGGGGNDTAVYSGKRNAYTVTHNANGSITIAGADGTDTLTNVEKAQFSDGTISLAIARNDFNADGKSDILWQNADGTGAVWLLNGATLTGGNTIGNPGSATWKAIGSGDFDGDGKADILWQNTDGSAAVWLMNGSTLAGGGVPGNPGPAWTALGAADFNGDGKSDILWRDGSGNIAIWLMNGATLTGGAVAGNPGNGWSYKGYGDFNGDGKTDLVFQNTDGSIAIWLMNGAIVTGGGPVGNPGSNWSVRAVGDFDGDGKSDLLLQDTSGAAVVWEMNGTTVSGGGPVGNPGTAWTVKMAEDVDGDGKADILWQAGDGSPAVWLMNGTNVTGGGIVGSNPGSNWHIVTG